MIGVASCSSFAFDSPSSALILLIGVHFITGFGLLVTDFILLTVSDDTEQVDRSLRAGLFPLFPAYCLGRGFFVLSTREATASYSDDVGSLYDWDQLGGPLFFLMLETLVTWVGALGLQVLGSYPRLSESLKEVIVSKFRAKVVPAAPPAAEPLPVAGPLRVAPAAHAASCGGSPARDTIGIRDLEDDSVVEERRAIDAMVANGVHAANDESELVLMHLRKQYGGVGGKLAVRDLCLRVQSGECFGFLGVNGAGKSTTFSMLTGATTPSSGDALLRGMSILTQQDQIRQLIGFCPQHDALESLLTARETLRLYARIKGVPFARIETEIDA